MCLWSIFLDADEDWYKNLWLDTVPDNNQGRQLLKLILSSSTGHHFFNIN